MRECESVRESERVREWVGEWVLETNGCWEEEGAGEVDVLQQQGAELLDARGGRRGRAGESVRGRRSSKSFHGRGGHLPGPRGLEGLRDPLSQEVRLRPHPGYASESEGVRVSELM